jgi:hypothetical protein
VRRRRRLLSRSDVRRALWALTALVLCEAVGTVGFHLLENFNWVDSFYEESMLATGQGPAISLVHDSSKVFASFMGFLSLGSTLTTLVFTAGPLLATVWHEARIAAEKEARRLEAELGRGAQELRRELHPQHPPDPAVRDGEGDPREAGTESERR